MARRKSGGPITQGAKALEKARVRLAEIRATKQASRSLSDSAKARLETATRKAKLAEIKAQYAAVKSAGLYQPTGAELTRGRKQRLRAAYRKLEDLSKKTVFARYPSVKPAEKDKVAALITKRGGVATKRGVFLPVEGGETRRGDTSLVRDRETGLYEIRLKYQRSTGYQGQVRYFIDGLASIEAQEKKLKKQFDAMVLAKKKNQALRFVIGGPNGNVSKRSFQSWDVFRQYLNHYRRDPAAMASFMAELSVIMVEKIGRETTYRQVTGQWADKRGRVREVAPDYLFDGGVLPRPKRQTRKGTRKQDKARR